MPVPVRLALGTMQLPDFKGRTFLVVEDDRASRGFLGELLRACGAIVIEADSVRAAKAFVGVMKFSLIVTDLAFPGENGAMLLEWLRVQPRDEGRSIPVVAVTAFSEQYPADRVGGWAAYFRKPLNLENFVQTIAAILKRPSALPNR